jgi:hypothetical protein
MLRKEKIMYMCPIPNGFRDRAISLYNSKIVDKKAILRKKAKKGKATPVTDREAHKVVRRRGSHIFSRQSALSWR